MNQKSLEKACEEYCPDEDHNGDYGQYLAEQVMKQKENEELEKRAELGYEIEFIKEVKNLRVKIDNIFGGVNNGV